MWCVGTKLQEPSAKNQQCPGRVRNATFMVCFPSTRAGGIPALNKAPGALFRRTKTDQTEFNGY